jgi:hypothetical protein
MTHDDTTNTNIKTHKQFLIEILASKIKYFEKCNLENKVITFTDICETMIKNYDFMIQNFPADFRKTVSRKLEEFRLQANIMTDQRYDVLLRW